jgi:hypothetical protein
MQQNGLLAPGKAGTSCKQLYQAIQDFVTISSTRQCMVSFSVLDCAHPLSPYLLWALKETAPHHELTQAKAKGYQARPLEVWVCPHI